MSDPTDLREGDILVAAGGVVPPGIPSGTRVVQNADGTWPPRPDVDWNVWFIESLLP